MARRYRKRPKRTNTTAQLVQIVGLALVLVIVLLFRDEIAGSAGALFAGFDSSDVQLPEERAQQPPATSGATTVAPTAD